MENNTGTQVVPLKPPWQPQPSPHLDKHGSFGQVRQDLEVVVGHMLAVVRQDGRVVVIHSDATEQGRHDATQCARLSCEDTTRA